MPVFQLNGVPLLSRSVLDRAEETRGDAQALREGWSEAKLLRVNARGQVRFEEGALVLDKAIELSPEPSPEAVFLGIDGGVHLWAVRDRDIQGALTDLRGMSNTVDDLTAGVLSTAVALLNWHDKAGFNSADGTATTSSKAGWSRTTEGGYEEFPRIDPAVICLIHDGGDRVLLARQHTWPETLFSLLAGFVEAGESLERCVEREVKEEVGVDVRDISYLGSQPWPFPRSLMLGFSAVGDPAQPLVFSDGEIAEAHWFTRAEVREALSAGDWSAQGTGARLLLPGSISIARTIMESWAALD
ncbi:NAD(+) diphosphatase [Nocardia sp. NPDC006044]|uniref:NAD(+) diphosphatase n=1 Tax=Nocardia sp. NPDC006044 TaxID=3364306 RepID=UPI0036A48D9C